MITLAVLIAWTASIRPAGAFGQNKINYQVFDWKVYHAPHFDIYYYTEEEDFVQQMVRYAESAYLQLSKDLDHEVKVRIPFIFFQNHTEFEQNNIILSFIPEAVGAFAEPIENRMVLPIDLPPEELYGLVVHELTHIFWYSILFDGKLSRSFRANPPLWLSEGLAEHMASRRDSLNKMVLRDAVVNNIIPPISRVNSLSFLTYRFGEAAFDFIEKEWGEEGVRNLLFEYRKVLLTNNLSKAIKESFGIDAEEFDRQFRRYMQREYVPIMLDKMEPEDYGREIGFERRDVFTFSPSLSPTGELVAVLTTRYEEVDVVILSARDGSKVRNLTKGFSNDYEYINTGVFKGQNDITWSPVGDNVAFFARKEDKRLLLIVNAITGKTVRRQELPIDQPASPSFSPDGRKILFTGNQNGVVDVFQLDLDTGELVNVTKDEFFDSNPRWSPDGTSAIYNRRINEFEKIFLVDLQDPDLKTQLTFGEHNDIEPSYSLDGKEIYFSSDAVPEEIFNTYTLDLESGEINRWTDMIGGNFTPLELAREDGERTVAVTTYSAGRYRLYRMTFSEPVETIRPEDRNYEPVEVVKFEPPLRLTLDDSQKGRYDKLRWHFEGNPNVGVGLTNDGTFLSQASLAWSDLFGDHRFIVNFNSVSTFANFDFIYANYKHRWDWFLQALDYRDFYTVATTGGATRLNKFRSVTGIQAGLSYPFNKSHRISTSLGVFQRDIEFPVTQTDGSLDFVGTSGTFPVISTTFTGDNARFKPLVGPWQGRRYDLTVRWAPTSTGDLGAFTNFYVDWRNYQKMTRNSTFAIRFFGALSNGEVKDGISSSDIFAIGGYNQIRGFDYREFFGNRATFANVELRFPLLDAIVVRGNFGFQGIQGVFFLDVGSAWFRGDQVWDPDLLVGTGPYQIGGLREFEFYGKRQIFVERDPVTAEPVFKSRTGLIDGRASYGFGFNFLFGPMLLNWSFAWRFPWLETRPAVDTDGNLIIDPETLQPEYLWIEEKPEGFRSDFYIGTRW